MASDALLVRSTDQNVARHDFRHAFDELEDVLPHPSCRNFIGGKRLIRAVEHTNTDEHIWPTLEQVIPPEAWQLLQQRHEAFPHPSGNFHCRTARKPEFPNDGEHAYLPASAAGREMRPFPSNDAIRVNFGKACRDTLGPALLNAAGGA